MGKKLVGVILLIAGVVLLLFGFSYINSAQYQVMSMVNSFTGNSDPTGHVAIGAGAIAAIVGLGVLLISGTAKPR